MSMEDLCSEKERLRLKYRALRQALTPQEAADASGELCRRLAEWEVLQSAERVLTYLAFGNEPDLIPLCESPSCPGMVWSAPRIEGQRLVPCLYHPHRLVRHRFGMMEPDSGSPELDPAALDVVLVPGIAFDREGGRLGFGGGFYDRLLATTGAVRVGIAHECCLADRLPCTETDLRMDWIATPSQIIECSHSGREA